MQICNGYAMIHLQIFSLHTKCDVSMQLKLTQLMKFKVSLVVPEKNKG